MCSSPVSSANDSVSLASVFFFDLAKDVSSQLVISALGGEPIAWPTEYVATALAMSEAGVQRSVLKELIAKRAQLGIESESTKPTLRIGGEVA